MLSGKCIALNTYIKRGKRRVMKSARGQNRWSPALSSYWNNGLVIIHRQKCLCGNLGIQVRGFKTSVEVKIEKGGLEKHCSSRFTDCGLSCGLGRNMSPAYPVPIQLFCDSATSPIHQVTQKMPCSLVTLITDPLISDLTTDLKVTLWPCTPRFKAVLPGQGPGKSHTSPYHQ